MPIRHGRNTQLLLQRNTGIYRAVPAPVGAFAMKFSEIEMGRDPQRQEDPTIQNTPLAVKKDDGEPTFNGSLKGILCLNDIGQWLSLLWGTPTTTGVGPYTHTFTLDLSERPDALLQLGYLNASKYPQWLGLMVGSMSWDVKEDDQSFNVELMAGEETSPEPVTAFDAAPTAYAKNRAVSKRGKVYDIDGATTLGRITKASVSIANDNEGQNVADGTEGYGEVLVGQPAISGSVSVLFDDTVNIFDHGRDHTTKPMTLISANKAGDNWLKLILPAVEFGEIKHKVATSKGLVIDTEWSAHADATPPTIELVNGIASY